MLGMTVGLFVVCLVSLVIAIEMNKDNMLIILPVMSFIIAILFLIVQVICTFEAKNKSEFYNKNFGTSYTAEDVYWNGTAIKDLVIGEKKNLNIKMDSAK